MELYQEKAFKITANYLVNVQKYTKAMVAKLFIVWSCKALQNWKCVIGCKYTNELIEVTYNGDKEEAYIDFYQKVDNHVMKDYSINQS